MAAQWGNLSSFEQGAGLALRKHFAEKLGLAEQESSWQNRREGFGDIVLSLGQLGASVEKVCHNINLLSSSEIGELYEAPALGKGIVGHGPQAQSALFRVR